MGRKKRNRLKELIAVKGYSIEAFADIIYFEYKVDQNVILGYIESGNPPNLQSQDLFHTAMMAKVLGVKFHELF